MTEQEWLEASDPRPMLDFLRGKVSDRKLRLFACACCRCMWGLLADDAWGRNLVELAERFTDGAASLTDLETARRLTEAADEEPSWSYFESKLSDTSAPVALADRATRSKRLRASWTAMATVSSPAQEAAAKASAVFAHQRRWLTERKEQAGIIRDVFVNPFRSLPTIDHRVLTCVRKGMRLRFDSICSVPNPFWRLTSVTEGMLANDAKCSNAIERRESVLKVGLPCQHGVFPHCHHRLCW